MRDYTVAEDREALIENMVKEINFLRALLLTSKKVMQMVETTDEAQYLLSTLQEQALPLAKEIDSVYVNLGVVESPPVFN